MAFPPETCDALIAGGGPVGATAAALLHASGHSVCLVDPPERAAAPPLRPVALAHGSRLLLEQTGAFARIPATPIETIHVSQAGGFGRTVIGCAEHGLPALGYVTDLAAVATAALGAAASTRVIGRVSSWHADAAGVRARVVAPGGEHEIAARLLVLADGGQLAGDDLALRDYGQSAIVARVRTEIVQPRTAWERFTASGPLALLPFGEREYAAVWTVRTGELSSLADAAEARFLALLGERFGHRLGRFTAASERASYPLRLWFRRSNRAGPRTVAIGNAAQTLHPVAGQGLNLGLRDAATLAALARRAAVADLGSDRFLGAFAAARRVDRLGAIGATDFLTSIFSNDSASLSLARGIGLAALDLVAPARRLLARRMMLGTRALP